MAARVIWLLEHWWMLGVAAVVFGVSIAGLVVLVDPPDRVGGAVLPWGDRRHSVGAADTSDGDDAA